MLWLLFAFIASTPFCFDTAEWWQPVWYCGVVYAAEEQRHLLLLWRAKSKLFVHAVELHAETRPLYCGGHIGTRLKDKILNAIKSRKRPVETLIRSFNEYEKNYYSNYPQNQFGIVQEGPLTYQKFIKLPPDDPFWQNVNFAHSNAPWAVSHDVQNGIHAFHLLKRTQEEGVILAKEVRRALNWGIHIYNIAQKRLTQLCKWF